MIDDRTHVNTGTHVHVSRSKQVLLFHQIIDIVGLDLFRIYFLRSTNREQSSL